MGLGFEFVQVQAEDLLSSIRLCEQNHHRTTVGRRLKMDRQGMCLPIWRVPVPRYVDVSERSRCQYFKKSMTSGTSKSNCSGESSQSSQN